MRSYFPQTAPQVTSVESACGSPLELGGLGQEPYLARLPVWGKGEQSRGTPVRQGYPITAIELGKASAATLQPGGPRLRCCVRVTIHFDLLDRPPKLEGHGGLQPVLGPLYREVPVSDSLPGWVQPPADMHGLFDA